MGASASKKKEVLGRSKSIKPGRKASVNEHGTNLDRLIHERTRLTIVSALAVNKVLTFNDLKAQLQISDGNLSTHARKLEDAGYIQCKKAFEGRIPRTEYKLSASGRKALKGYISHMEALINTIKKV